MTNNIPYLRNKTPTLLTMSTTAIALLLTSPILFSHSLLRPVQPSTLPPNIQTPNPVALGDNCNVANAQMAFNAQGMDLGPAPKGAFQITDSSSGKILWNGDFYSATPGDDGAMKKLT